MRSALLRMGIGNLLSCWAVMAAMAAPPAYTQEKAPNAPKAAAKKGDSGKGEQRRGILPPYYRNVVDEKQREAIYKIQEEYAPKIANLKSQLESLTKDRDAKIAAVLTPEQRKKVEQLQAEAKDKRGQKPAAKTPKPGTDAPKPSSPPAAK